MVARGWSGAPSLRLVLLATVLLGALAIALARPGGGSGVAGALEGRLLDARFQVRGALPAPDSVAVIALDDADLQLLGRFPPPRAALASAVDAATEAGASAVALDLLLLNDAADDGVLEEALRRNGRAVLGASRVEESQPDDRALQSALARSAFPVVIGDAPTEGYRMTGPTPLLAQAATLGHVNVATEVDGALRRLPAAIAAQGADGLQWLPGLGVAALIRAGVGPIVFSPPDRDGRGGALRVGAFEMPLSASAETPLMYYGGRQSIATWPLRDAAKADLKGRIVLIGAAALGFGDTFPTPYDTALPGVLAHATLVASILDGAALRRDATTWSADVAISLIAAFAAFAAAAQARPVTAYAAVAAVTLVTALAIQGAFLAGWWLDSVSHIGALSIGASGGLALRLVQNRRRAANLARYQSPLLTETLATQENPEFDGRDQRAVALFVDVQGFTRISEAIGPTGTKIFLRDFHAGIERAAMAHRGVVEQFAGDGAMVIFGLPEPDMTDPDRALACIETLLKEAALLDDPDAGAVTIRVGAHFGDVAAGILGGDRHRHVSISGDVVNTASRLQEHAKQNGVTIAVSDALLAASGDPEDWRERLCLTGMGPQHLRGRTAALDVWAGGPGHPLPPVAARERA